MLPDLAVGATIAAAIAAVISLLGLVIAKEQKVSEFRQAWIDALRDEVSALISHVNAIHAAKMTGSKSASEAWALVREDFVGVNNATGKIRLRLNPDEDISKSILKVVEQLASILNSSAAPDHQRIHDLEIELVDHTQKLLKAEWRRVKSGEKVYKTASIFAVAMVVGTAIFAAAVATTWLLPTAITLFN